MKLIRIFCLLGLMVGSISVFAAEKEFRPNILWILADDMGPDAGCYGTPAVKTPNIDQLAREGVRFTQAFTTAPVCSPSRSALITGMYQTTIGAHHHRSNRDAPLPKGIKPITEYFRENGYFTANLKNISSNAKPSGKTDFNFKEEKVFEGSEWDELKSRQPFYAQINFQAPHRGKDWADARKLPNRVDPAQIKIPPYYPDHPVTRGDYANYFEAIQIADAKLGVVLKKLAEDDLDKNTIVIFLGDNGRCMVRDKQWLYDGGLHIPLIVRWPGNLKPGTVRDDLVSSIDISATSLHLAGIKFPKNMQGQIFLGPKAQERKHIFGARDRCDETMDRIRCVRTRDFSYIRNYHPEFPYTQRNAYKERAYPVLELMKQLHAEGKLTPAQELFMAPRKPAEELYDLRNDPDEIHSLADSPTHRKVLRELRKVLDQWIEKTDDQGRFPESENMHKRSQQRMEAEKQP
ncbi:MAG: sulfatase [Verrucomicrobiota bacterium]